MWITAYFVPVLSACPADGTRGTEQAIIEGFVSPEACSTAALAIGRNLRSVDRNLTQGKAR